MRTLVWFRGKDLRISDHAPLRAALDTGIVIPLFVLDPFFFEPQRAQAMPHRIQYLLESLTALEQNLAACGARLLIVSGRSVDVVPRVARELDVERVVAQRWVEPFARLRDAEITRRLHVPFDLFEGETLLAPGTLRTGGGTPYAVFTHFARAFHNTLEVGPALPRPKRIAPFAAPKSLQTVAIPTLKTLGIEHNPQLVAGGERAARERMTQFFKRAASQYDTARDRMDLPGTSRLSQDLKFGTLSVRTLWLRCEQEFGQSAAAASFQNELVWREFTHSTLWDRPEVLKRPYRPEFIGFPWQDDEAGLSAWKRGCTGYPVVDAAQRQLLAEGFVHNRARMITASFLTKHLMIDYREGEAHFMRYLTDGDWASNNAGWQWSAGTGCDAQPYFRIFNPVTQGKRFDPEGEYVKRWVPELQSVPTKFVHSPWLLPKPLAALAKDYPEPVVEHTFARNRYLQIATAHLNSRKRGSAHEE
jgi:deoxyribodipyrimidine photo-lyase